MSDHNERVEAYKLQMKRSSDVYSKDKDSRAEEPLPVIDELLEEFDVASVPVLKERLESLLDHAAEGVAVNGNRALNAARVFGVSAGLSTAVLIASEVGYFVFNPGTVDERPVINCDAPIQSETCLILNQVAEDVAAVSKKAVKAEIESVQEVREENANMIANIASLPVGLTFFAMSAFLFRREQWRGKHQSYAEKYDDLKNAHGIDIHHDEPEI